MNVRIDLNEPKILAKVQNDRFGLLVSNEWKRLIDPEKHRNDARHGKGSALENPLHSAVFKRRVLWQGKEFPKEKPIFHL